MVGYQILRRHILAGGILEESRRTVQSESFLLLATRENNLFRSGLGLRCQFRKQLGGRPKVTPAEWFIKNYGWYKQLFKDPESWEFACNEWKQNRPIFLLALDSLQSYAAMLEGAAKNEFKRWNSLNNTDFWGFKEPYSSYDEAVDSLQSWIRQRIAWIDEHI